MTVQFDRQAGLFIGTRSKIIDVSGLRIRFTVRRGDIQTPNTLEVRVYNLADATAQLIQQEFTDVTLEAGYPGNQGVIFRGEVKQVRRGRESALDTYLDLSAADGDSAYNHAVVSVSLNAGSRPVDHAQSLVDAMSDHGITGGDRAALSSKRLPRGKVLFGLARDHARRLARSEQQSWSIQDGRLTMIPESAYLPGDVIELTSATGVIGFPEQVQGGIRVTCLLNPSIKVGGRVKLNNASVRDFKFGLSLGAFEKEQFIPSKAQDGIYRVLFTEHQGDTRGQEWYTTVTCLALGAPPPPEQLRRETILPSGAVPRHG